MASLCLRLVIIVLFCEEISPSLNFSSIVSESLDKPSPVFAEISIKEALKSLPDREKKILNLRFMQGKTQMEVAKEIGISQAQVSRVEKGAIDKLRKLMD